MSANTSPTIQGYHRQVKECLPEPLPWLYYCLEVAMVSRIIADNPGGSYCAGSGLTLLALLCQGENEELLDACVELILGSQMAQGYIALTQPGITMATLKDSLRTMVSQARLSPELWVGIRKLLCFLGIKDTIQIETNCVSFQQFAAQWPVSFPTASAGVKGPLFSCEVIPSKEKPTIKVKIDLATPLLPSVLQNARTQDTKSGPDILSFLGCPTYYLFQPKIFDNIGSRRISDDADSCNMYLALPRFGLIEQQSLHEEKRLHEEKSVISLGRLSIEIGLRIHSREALSCVTTNERQKLYPRSAASNQFLVLDTIVLNCPTFFCNLSRLPDGQLFAVTPEMERNARNSQYFQFKGMSFPAFPNGYRNPCYEEFEQSINGEWTRITQQDDEPWAYAAGFWDLSEADSPSSSQRKIPHNMATFFLYSAVKAAGGQVPEAFSSQTTALALAHRVLSPACGERSVRLAGLFEEIGGWHSTQLDVAMQRDLLEKFVVLCGGQCGQFGPIRDVDQLVESGIFTLVGLYKANLDNQQPDPQGCKRVHCPGLPNKEYLSSLFSIYQGLMPIEWSKLPRAQRPIFNLFVEFFWFMYPLLFHLWPCLLLIAERGIPILDCFGDRIRVDWNAPVCELIQTNDGKYIIGVPNCEFWASQITDGFIPLSLLDPRYSKALLDLRCGDQPLALVVRERLLLLALILASLRRRRNNRGPTLPPELWEMIFNDYLRGRGN